MVLTLIAALIFQPAGQATTGFVCMSDPATGDVEIVMTRRNLDGVLEADIDGKWASARLEDRPEAANLDWYRSGAPIVRDGVRYVRTEQTSSHGTAVNRYFRHVGLHDGAPLFSVWPGGDIDLAVLVSQQGCVFHVYRRERP